MTMGFRLISNPFTLFMNTPPSVALLASPATDLNRSWSKESDQQPLFSATLPSSHDGSLATASAWASSSIPMVQLGPNLPAPVQSLDDREVDLTEKVRAKPALAVAHGGFSDIHVGELEETLRDHYGPRRIIRRKVAIKLLRALNCQRLDLERLKKRLNQEAHVWSRLNHENIAKFLGMSYHMGGRPSMIMLWYKNGSVTDYLKTINRNADRLMLIRDIAKGLTYLHSLSPPIIHGDLRMNNVIITDDGHAALSDFGLFQVVQELAGPAENSTPHTAGLVRWQAPELIQDDENHISWKIIQPSDVWSFACTACQLLADTIPYHDRKTVAYIIQAILSGVTPFQRQDLPDNKSRVYEALWMIFNKCWSHVPERRPVMTALDQEIYELCVSS